MALLRTIRIVSIGGNQVATFADVDVCSATGWETLCQVAQALGFPSASLSLVTQSAVVIDHSLPLQESIGPDGCDDPIALTCVLGPSRAVGVKREHWMMRTNKIGMILGRRLRRHAGDKPFFKICRELDPSLQDDVKQLITESFAPRLKELIHVAVRAAYQPATATALSTPAEECVFKDESFGACINLSSCRLWTSVPDFSIKDVAPESLWFGGDPDPVFAGAVLWRLLDGWPGAAPDAAGGAVAAGPVLEVLFAAAHPDLQELGVAGHLMAELEEVATLMGCAAVAVAAVPHQGRRFWAKQGYLVHATLIEIALQGDGDNLSESSKMQTTLEPGTALGEFLKSKMLLFTDTPLVAKVLRTS
eukprot:CAMPEP_0203914764 /NCGR_PEP_ID=MMETSP0359-20131031/55622_1 /ASSEMBLY_ACC=CAM_ASM_000338 /TAXON_ID=268821 /ORGANISM="Scrippsiella Hangoei, Strain SHTV-5" /LENGTH=361 /DNA_ID=CAMNT_0050841129 /DNA_START=60 /DNA_END=1145 /DNA_ORIENTATION=-